MKSQIIDKINFLHKRFVRNNPSSRHSRIETVFITIRQISTTRPGCHGIQEITIVITITCIQNSRLTLLTFISSIRSICILVVNSRSRYVMLPKSPVISQFSLKVCLYIQTFECLVAQFKYCRIGTPDSGDVRQRTGLLIDACTVFLVSIRLFRLLIHRSLIIKRDSERSSQSFSDSIKTLV